jgi:hypothetical protein
MQQEVPSTPRMLVGGVQVAFDAQPEDYLRPHGEESLAVCPQETAGWPERWARLIAHGNAMHRGDSTP